MHLARFWLFLSVDKFKSKFPPNVIVNQKYNIITFLPMVLYEQVCDE